jgi:hypothetical protein
MPPRVCPSLEKLAYSKGVSGSLSKRAKQERDNKYLTVNLPGTTQLDPQCGMVQRPLSDIDLTKLNLWLLFGKISNDSLENSERKEPPHIEFSFALKESFEFFPNNNHKLSFVKAPI